MKTKCFEISNPTIDLSSSTLFGFEFTNDNVGLLVQQSSGEFVCIEISGVTHFNLTPNAAGLNCFVEEGSPSNKYFIEDNSGHPFLQVTANSIELNGQV